MQLAHSRLRQIKRPSDVLHGEFFVVVQRQDQLLGDREALLKQSLQFSALHSIAGVILTVVANHIDFTDIFVGIAVERFPIERDHGHRSRISKDLLVLRVINTKFTGNFVVVW